MKTKSKSKKKYIPQYFQKKTSASTSQLVKIGSYKRRINDLVRNNRRLAVALQEARCEVSSQSKILREYYTRDSKNITLARLKIRDMVKTINTLVCDIDEVKKFLDIDWAPIKEKIMQSRYTSDSKIIKVPSYEAIEEVSISAQDPPILSPEEIPSSSQSSQPTAEWISSLKPCDPKTVLFGTSKSDPSNDLDCVSRSNEATSPLGEHEIPAVLFVDESDDQNKKNKRSTKSKEKSDLSLTPEFDIDFTFYRRKKSSSRRRTLFHSSSSKTSKSSERVASYEQADPVEVECETSPTGDFVIQESEITPSSLTENQGQSENCKSLSDSSPKTPCISKSKANSVNDQFTSLPVFSMENAPSFTQKTEVVPKQIEYNHTLLLNEDMEFTDIINSCDPILVGKNISTACTSHIAQRVISDTYSENENNEIAKEENVNMTEALKVNEENADFSTADKEQIFSTKETPFQEVIAINQNNKRKRKSKQKDSSPLLGVRSRHKTVTKYLIFSSDDESDSDYTPCKQTVKKKKCKGRETAIFVADAAPKITATENIEDCFSQQKHSFQFGNKTKSDDLSVFNFNASFSDKSDNHGKQKKSKLSRNKKSKESKGKEVPAKPLSQTCNVTKLRGFTLKFSKSEYVDKKNKSENIVLPKGSEIPLGSSTSLNHPMEKETLTIESNVNKEKSPSSDEKIEQNEIMTENKCNSPLADFGSLLSPRTILKNRNANQGRKSEAKRVSFNASDLVCNFTKTSLSKTIAHNAKVWQTSRSVVDLEENLPSFAKHAMCQEVPHDGILSDKNALDTRVNAQNSSLDYSDETEIYKFSYQLNDDTFPVFAEVDNLPFLQKVTSNELQINKSSSYLGAHNSDKTDVLVENTDKMNTVSSDGEDILSRKNVVKKKSSRGNKCKQLKTPTSPALKIKNCKEPPQKNRHSSSKENVENNPKINKASKHRNSKILEMLTFNDNCSSEKTVGNSCLNIKSPIVSLRKDILQEKNKILSSGKQKKNNSVKKCVQSTPVLRDAMNLGSSFSLTPKMPLMKPQIEEPLEKSQELPQRRSRSKQICYKEPSLMKKLRRNT